MDDEIMIVLNGVRAFEGSGLGKPTELACKKIAGFGIRVGHSGSRRDDVGFRLCECDGEIDRFSGGVALAVARKRTDN